MNKDAAALHFGNKPGQSPFALGYDDNYTFQQQTAEVLKRFTVQVAKQTHGAFQKFFLFIHGINSGYALWVCIFAFVFTGSNPTQFFYNYRSIVFDYTSFILSLSGSMYGGYLGQVRTRDIHCIELKYFCRIDPVKFNRTYFYNRLRRKIVQ